MQLSVLHGGTLLSVDNIVCALYYGFVSSIRESKGNIIITISWSSVLDILNVV